jgi:ADP-ribosylglycohydrolase
MLGAIIGDIIGTQFEFHNINNTDFTLFNKELCTFSDDTVCTVAIADAILNGTNNFQDSLKKWAYKYPDAGYGRKFLDWLAAPDPEPMDSYGNGCAMRVSPCAWVFDGCQDTIDLALSSCRVSHIHPESIKGTSAIAYAIWLARNKYDKKQIHDYIIETSEISKYNLDLNVEDIRRENKVFNASCQVTVPQAIFAFLNTDSFENCIRYAVSFGGDCDTIAAMAGSIAEAYYEDLPVNIIYEAMTYLPDEMKEIITKFYDKYINPKRRTKIKITIE